MADRIQKDPYLEGFFSLELNVKDEAVAFFKSIEGGGMQITVIEHTLMYPDGSSRGIYIPGATAFEPVVLSYGVTDHLDFWEWWLRVANGNRERIDASIIAYGRVLNQKADGVTELSYKTKKTDRADGQNGLTAASKTVERKLTKKIARWDLEDVWPSSISGFSFDLDSTEAYIASVTLVAEDIKRVQPDA